MNDELSEVSSAICNDSSSESSSISSNCFYNIFDNLSENEYNDILDNVEYLFDIYINDYGVKMKEAKFYDDCVINITNELYNNWCEANLSNISKYDNIYSIIESICYGLFYKKNIPSYVSLNSYDNYNDISDVDNKIEYLKNIPQPEQRTKEWYKFRQNILSASTIWKIFKSETTLKNLIAEKVKNNIKNISAPSMEWGNKYEPVSIMIYEDKFNTKIGEFGCIKHNEYDFIGASPDGINIDKTNKLFGRMLEIKNIVNRDITGIPKEDYWIQTQVQMETCDLDYCDFLETRINEYSEFEFYNDTIHEYKGVILHFSKIVNENNMYNYSEVNKAHWEYYPINKYIDNEDINTWITNIKEKNKEEYTLYTTIYWYLDELSCVLIKRNKLWFNHALPHIKNCYNQIQKEKNKSKLIIDVDNFNNHLIRNMPSPDKKILIVKNTN